jgi:DNA-binding GntR family transcriptional regulator
MPPLAARGQPAIVDILRDAIRQRLLPPGSQLVQASIAEALGVSRIPVREALQFLASEGVVTFTDDGARVTELRPPEVHELWSLRALLEPRLAEGIVRNATAGDIDALRQQVRQMDDAPDDAWSDLNHAFHLELYRLSGMRHHAAAAARVLNQIEPYSRVSVNRLQGRLAAQSEHHEMIAALDDHDAARLAEVLERHSTRARDLLVAYAESAAAESAQSETSEAARAFASRLATS